MKVKLDGQQAAANYSRAFQRLKQMPGFDQEVVLRAEMGSILKAWAGRTKVFTEDGVLRNSRLRALRALGMTNFDKAKNFPPVTITAGIRHPEHVGYVWIKRRNGGKKAMLAGIADITTGTVTAMFVNRRKPSPAITSAASWAATEYPKAYKAVRGSQGLARQSVLQIAKQMNIDLHKISGGHLSAAGLAKAETALAASGGFHQNGYGFQKGDGTRFSIEGVNCLPYNWKIYMDQDLMWVLQGRAKMIEKAYRKGAFESIEKTMRQFPNVFRSIYIT